MCVKLNKVGIHNLMCVKLNKVGIHNLMCVKLNKARNSQSNVC